jgi:uncharacterized protein
MAIIGKRNRLQVVREAPPGLYLDAGGDQEILLPGRYIPRGIKMGDEIDVFVYLDSEDRLVATTETPLTTVGEFSYLKVISMNEQIGAFLDWGLSKDLLLPFREQVGQVQVGQRVVVYTYLDTKSSRIVASMRLNQHLSGKFPKYKDGQAVQILISSKTPLGYNAIVENEFSGLLYSTNLSAPLQVGASLKAFIHSVRPDGKIDLKLDASGYQKVTSIREQILEALKRNGGRLEFDIKSSPAEIRKAFNVSKNTFKLALSALYKDRIVHFVRDGTELQNKEK